ncbi:CHAT domain-containing protein [Asanoa siamensis]|uniref:CHAT domain-containing protein n=1 Tax=Asanoa siamensis TaxID=926357 RepID=A0ABQ4CNX7_9ACTN|nr:CHAT domain-containing protein [Asanoa siamensis]GIF73004.1 hypothetical protein Asi02nite_25220 [Asanoa siamensis]
MTRQDRSETVGRARAIARIQDVLGAAADRTLVDPHAAIAEMAGLAAAFAGDQQVRALALGARSALELASGYPLGDAHAMRAALADLGELAEEGHEGAEVLALMPDYLDAVRAHQDGDTETAFAIFDDVRARAGALPPGNVLRAALEEIAPMLDAMRGTDPAPVPAAPPGASPATRALHLVARGGMAMRQGAETNLSAIDAGIDDLREAVTLTPDNHPDHVFHLASLALGLGHRAEVTGAGADVDQAIATLERARELARGPEHPQWSFVNEMLAGLRRRRGEAPPARLAALDGLQGYTWRVLLEPDPASARAYAREAAEEAMATAGRCLVDHQPADALRALDSGRALMLFAATELRDPYTRLVEAGRADLADAWRDADDPPPRLREQVLDVLVRDTGVLDPPDLGAIQDALRRLGADALVYLVPARSPAPGWAVIAPADGPPRYLALPHLAIEPGTDVERHLATMTSGDRGLPREIGPAGTDPFAGSVDALCGWAWKAAMGPVVRPYLGQEGVPRLVLVPMGELARVPWQAARGPDGTHVVEHVAVSQAASARMLCATAAAEPVRVGSGGLVLADPDTAGRAAALRSARLEAYAIQQVFYPGATYVGRRPDGSVSRSGAGTPDDVRSWLRADDSRGALLHLASHGTIETASSRLLLAGGDLTAGELIGLLSEDGRRAPALVVLAACHTGRSIHGYDEAYSLGTVFLAAGARSVLSTQWSIPDEDTSLLMYMFHHFLATERREPWDALRRAQLWMLDDDRRPPDRMPGPLRRVLDGAAPERVAAWAGFIHWGR